MEKLWYVPSAIILGGVALGPLGVQVGVLSPLAGWALFSLGGVFAVLALPATAGAAAFASATGRAWRGVAVRAAVVPLLVVGALILPNLRKLEPRIHDITTDPADALQFSPEVDVEGRRETGFTREQVLALQSAAYPDVESLVVPGNPDEVFARAVVTAKSMPSWEVTDTDPSQGRIEAIATSRTFRFVDDIVIRVAATDSEAEPRSVIDMRSRSRVGQSDLGANAARIRSYWEALGFEPGS